MTLHRVRKPGRPYQTGPDGLRAVYRASTAIRWALQRTTRQETKMNIARHSCGAEWHQIASRTGHCCGCHRTFSSEEIFDGHRLDGVCLDPATLLKKDGTPRFETFTDLAGCEVWRSTKRMSAARVASFKALKAKRRADAA